MLILCCSRCKLEWKILLVDTIAYHLRVAENVCWNYEPEGW
jgi:hypothetical protein